MPVSRALRSQGLYVAHHIRGLRTTARASTFKVGHPPQSHWRVGDGAAPPPSHVSDKIRTIEVKDAVPRDLYQILGSAIVPRPIAFVSTLSADGVPNLAPFSYFSMDRSDILGAGSPAQMGSREPFGGSTFYEA